MREILERNSKRNAVASDDPWRLAQAEKIREAMGPEFRAVADQLRIDFDAKLTWFEGEGMSMGKEP